MTRALNERLLQKFERPIGNPMVAEWLAAVYDVDRRYRAAETLAKFAQALAGMEAPAPPPVRSEPSPAPAPAPLPRSSRPTWGPHNPPRVHDVLTWEEAMRYFWLTENASAGKES